MKLLYILFGLTYFTQGIGSLASQPLYYYLRETLGISISTIMWMGSITSLPWMIKPLYGFLSDSIPLLGYKRKSYIILSAILSSVAMLILGISPFYSIPVLVFFLILDSIGGAIKDVAIDGVMVEEGKRLGNTGTFQSVQWGALYISQIITGVAGGYLAEHSNYRVSYLLVAAFPILIGYFAYLYKEEKSAPVRKTLEIKKWLSAMSRRDFLLSGAFLFCLWFRPSFGTPLMEIMRTQLNMSKIWIGWLGTIGAVCSLIGSVLYFRYAKDLNLRKWLIWSTIISTITTAAYLYVDKNAFLAYTIIGGISGAFIHLLLLDFMARTCPEGTEATTFALLCSLVNFGTFCSNSMGAMLFDNI
jgi:predicted MFS family arabinose efflux permease